MDILRTQLLEDDDEEVEEQEENAPFNAASIANIEAFLESCGLPENDTLLEEIDNELPSVTTSEQPPWPLAKGRSPLDKGASGGPLLCTDFVSQYIQIRQFKEACLSQLQVCASSNDLSL
jgi:hypothetical protein